VAKTANEGHQPNGLICFSDLADAMQAVVELDRDSSEFILSSMLEFLRDR
jgi:hypothetical protein